jgi:hypothetical protein
LFVSWATTLSVRMHRFGQRVTHFPPQEVAVRIHSAFSSRLVRALLLCAPLAVLAACGGGGSSGSNAVPNPGSSNYCDSNSNGVLLARPTSGFPMTSANTIEIVSNGNGDQLYQSYTMFDLILRDNFGNQYTTNPLSIVSDANGPHPYSSDFYYAGTVQGGLPSGDTFQVYLNAFNTNCTPLSVGFFST